MLKEFIEVTRCRECQHAIKCAENYCFCKKIDCMKRNDFYCADGERRNNNVITENKNINRAENLEHH